MSSLSGNNTPEASGALFLWLRLSQIKGPRKVAGVKGDKRRWVLDVTYPEFVHKFKGIGLNAESLKQVSSPRAYFGDAQLS